MKTLNLVQGTPEWFAHRANHFNASDAPAMMGCSKYKTRTQLLDELKSGISKEVDPATQKRFDDGHRYEALARPIAEQTIGEELFPVTGVNGKLSASFDGLTMLEDVAFEHKSLNDDIRKCETADDLHLMYRVQMEQQLMVSGAGKCLFMATAWNANNELIEKREFWYTPDQALRGQILAGWVQFEADLLNHVVEEKTVKPIGKAPESLPALRVEATGMVTNSNLAEYAETAIAVFRSINKNLVNDDDFADAEKAIKWCKGVEDSIESTKSGILAQTKSIDDVFRALDSIKDEGRQTRLTLEKLVKAEKENKKNEIVFEARNALIEHINLIKAGFDSDYMPAIQANFGEEIKGLKTISSMKNAVSVVLANAKAAATQAGERITANRLIVKDDMHLFPDFAQHCMAEPKLFSALLDQRKAQHQQRVEAEASAKAASEAVAEPVASKPAPVAAPSNVIPAGFAAKVTPAAAVIEAEPRIAAFLNSREWANGKANEYRAVLVEFFKFEAKEAA